MIASEGAHVVRISGGDDRASQAYGRRHDDGVDSRADTCPRSKPAGEPDGPKVKPDPADPAHEESIDAHVGGITPIDLGEDRHRHHALCVLELGPPGNGESAVAQHAARAGPAEGVDRLGFLGSGIAPGSIGLGEQLLRHGAALGLDLVEELPERHVVQLPADGDLNETAKPVRPRDRPRLGEQIVVQLDGLSGHPPMVRRGHDEAGCKSVSPACDDVLPGDRRPSRSARGLADESASHTVATSEEHR